MFTIPHQKAHIQFENNSWNDFSYQINYGTLELVNKTKTTFKRIGAFQLLLNEITGLSFVNGPLKKHKN